MFQWIFLPLVWVSWYLYFP